MMERIDIKTAMFILTTLSVVAPTANYLAPAPPPAAEESPAIASSLPTRTSSEMKTALLALQDTSATQAQFQSRNEVARKPGPVARDPFRLIPLATSPQQMEEPIPVISLLGLVQTTTGTVATLEIDGAMVTLRIGETAKAVTLKTVTPPDGATVTFGKREVKLRLL